MEIKNFINNLFKQNNENMHDFSILNDKGNIPPNPQEMKTNIFPNIQQNLEFLKSKYNTLLNSDIIIREFNMSANNKEYKAFIIYIDGLADSISINDFVLEPLMLRRKQNNSIFQNNLAEYVDYCLLPQTSVKKVTEFEKVLSSINSGNCLLFIDTLAIAFDIDVKNYKQRSINNPENETIIKGPQEGFIENLRTNTSLLRRSVNNENLVIENIPVGNISQTKCGVCYIQNIANGDLIAEVK